MHKIELVFRLALSVARHYLFAQGDHDGVKYIDNVFIAAESGKNIDRHLEVVAEFLRGGGRPNFAGLTTELQIEVDDFLSRGETDDPED